METLNGTKQKSPDTNRLELLLEKIEAGLDNKEPLTEAILNLDESETLDLINAVRWTCAYLNDRKVYHKRQQLKKREFERVAKRMLAADEVAAIERKVNAMTEAELLGGGDND